MVFKQIQERNNARGPISSLALINRIYPLKKESYLASLVYDS